MQYPCINCLQRKMVQVGFARFQYEYLIYIDVGYVCTALNKWNKFIVYRTLIVRPFVIQFNMEEHWFKKWIGGVRRGTIWHCHFKCEWILISQTCKHRKYAYLVKQNVTKFDNNKNNTYFSICVSLRVIFGIQYVNLLLTKNYSLFIVFREFIYK